MKVIKDFQIYLGEIEKLTKRLDPKQKKELEKILTSLLTLLVSLRQASHLGEMKVTFKRDKN